MNIFITGANGFIGSHLTEKLSADNEIEALIRYNSRRDTGLLKFSSRMNKVNIRFGDVTDYHHIKNLTEETDCIIHLASLIGIPYSYTAPYSYLKNNIEGTLNILQAGLKNRIKHIIIISSSEVYGTNPDIPLKETHALCPQSPYAATKVSAEALAMSYLRSFSLPVTVLRPFNTYGPRQSLRAVIPTIVCQAIKGSSIKLGRTDVKRDFNYIEDTVRGIEKTVMNPDTIGRIINIGSGEMHSIGEIINAVSDISGRELIAETESSRMRPPSSEVDHLLADISLAEEILGYEPAVGFKNGIIRTYKWFEDNRDKWNNMPTYQE